MDEQSPAGESGIYVLAAHPAWSRSRVNRRLRDTAKQLPGVRVQDLYARYPDFDIDVAAEQANVSAARLLVLLHPIQWYSMPPLLKLWLDEVLTHGWACPCWASCGPRRTTCTWPRAASRCSTWRRGGSSVTSTSGRRSAAGWTARALACR